MKYLKKITLILIIFGLSISQVKAVQLNPNSGSVSLNSTQSVNLTASPPSAGSTTVQVRLVLSGPAQVTGYTPPPSGQYFTLFGACPGGVGFTLTTVCADISKSGSNLNSGEGLGSFTFTNNNSGTVTISKASNNGYVIGSGSTSTVQSDTSGGATFNVSASGGTSSVGVTKSLPNTALGNSILLPLIGIIFCVVGISLYNERKNKF